MTKDTTTELEKINASIERWQRRLNRAVGAIKRLDAKRKRLNRKLLEATLPTTEPVVVVTVPATSHVAVTAAKLVEAKPAVVADVSEDLPAFLDRRSPKSAEDQAVADKILADRAEHKRQKDIGSKARRKAERSGATRKMPLQGAAALAAIRGAT